MRNGLNIPRPHHPSRFYIPTRSLSSVVIFDNKMKLAKLGYFEGIYRGAASGIMKNERPCAGAHFFFWPELLLLFVNYSRDSAVSSACKGIFFQNVS
jgi:hypothetical protein